MSNIEFVAEMSANHLGDKGRALAIVDAAAKAGATMLKLQCWTKNTMAINSSLRIESGPWAGRTLYDLYAEAWTPWDWFPDIMDRCASHSIECFASAFDLGAVSFLESLNVKRHKVSSFELVDDELVRACALTGKPLILSTGMATFPEIRHAVSEAEDMGLRTLENLTLLRCVSAYPSLSHEAGLGALAYLDGYYECNVGISDHTKGNAVSIAASVLGASMIERHLTLARADGGPDAGFSLEPHEFAAMVRDCNNATAASRGAEIAPRDSERSQISLRRSLWWARDLPEGQMVMRTDITSARPAAGLSCSKLNYVVGSKLRKPVRAGEPVKYGEFER